MTSGREKQSRVRQLGREPCRPGQSLVDISDLLAEHIRNEMINGDEKRAERIAVVRDQLSTLLQEPRR